MNEILFLITLGLGLVVGSIYYLSLTETFYALAYPQKNILSLNAARFNYNLRVLLIAMATISAIGILTNGISLIEGMTAHIPAVIMLSLGYLFFIIGLLRYLAEVVIRFVFAKEFRKTLIPNSKKQRVHAIISSGFGLIGGLFGTTFIFIL